jgi:ketosteroid isomerase-like protein
MTLEHSAVHPSRLIHSNAQLIEKLYSALRDGDPSAAATCYAHDAKFQDIAFRLQGRERIHQMWRLVCHGNVAVTFASIVADDQTGGGHWVASYSFGKSATKPGRPVVNKTTSEFIFRNGLITSHRDRCDAKAWAAQAYPFPINLLAGSIGPLRRYMAHRKLHRFVSHGAPLSQEVKQTAAAVQRPSPTRSATDPRW